MVSIYHFFKDIFEKKKHFLNVKSLRKFPYEPELLSCSSKGKFPDMAIRINKGSDLFTGGELIELKDSKSYTVSSFNSTIPTGKKEISKVVASENTAIGQQMQKAGNDIYSLPLRDVFYLVRGRRKKIYTKVCLVHGSFFETIGVDKLINRAFSQVLDERMKETGEQISGESQEKLLSIFSEQENFSKVRDVEKASVKIRFRIMTEVKAEGNILNDKKYPQIKDNTLNFVLPCHNETEEQSHIQKMKIVFGDKNLDSFSRFKIKHYFNGNFLVFQSPL